MDATITSFFYYFIASFSTVLLVILATRWFAARSWVCTCGNCTAYLTSSWKQDFHNLADWYTHLLRQSPTKTIHIHVLGNTITANPATVEHMLRTKFHNYPKGKSFSSILGDLLGHGIFNVDGQHWSFQRKMASLELGSVSVRSYAFQTVNQEVGRRLLPLLDSVSGGNRVLDLQDVFRRFSFDTICKISFGLDPGCLELDLPITEFAAAFDEASRISALRATSVSPWIWKLKRLLNCGEERVLRRAIGLVNVLAREVIRQKRKMGFFSSNHDLLSRFMGTINDDTYLKDIVISFLLAGRDTVASGITSFFLLLSSHPEVESKMIEEITSTMSSKDQEIPSYEQLQGLHYVHAALYEAMRLYPPIQFDSKFTVEDDVFPDGTFVKKGTRVTYHAYAMGRMEETWGPDWHLFCPDRWLDEDRRFVSASPIKFPTFHAGPRMCLGKEMALMEMKCVVVSIIRHFKIDVVGAGNGEPRFVSGLTASLLGGLPVRVRRRNPSS